MQNPIVEYLRSQIGQPIQGPSPAGNWLQGVLRSVDPGHISANYTIRQELTNPVGTLHGGVTALIMDEIIGTTLFSLHNDFLYTSVNLVVDFLLPGNLNETVTATAKVVRKGTKLAHVECVIYNERGKLMARGSSNLVVTKNRSPLKS